MIPGTAMDALDVVVWAATVLVIFFVLQYTLSSPWWRDPVGRSVVAKDIALLLLLIPACVVLVWPQALGLWERFAVDMASLGGVTAVMAWRCVVWWKISPPWPFPRRDGRPRMHLPRWFPRR